MTLYEKLAEISTKAQGSYWAERISAELSYMTALSKAKENAFDVDIGGAAVFLLECLREEGTITKTAATKAEEMLQHLSAQAKEYKAYCVSHAHIDMNWMWGFQETAAVTVDTFRTVLNLMKEYPAFTFSQSQASTYKIIEQYDPAMLEEIKERIHKGQWEVTASTWVETDKNMPNGESLARHILYTKRYLSKLLDIAPDSMQLDFEPDTFGHNWSVPEIMQKGGVKYYYHCRGYDGQNIYNWRARSGATVLVYRDPKWYNGEVRPDFFLDLPEICDKYGIDILLRVYGVGDHGGGPTRRDVERLMDMAQWPLHPTVVFGTYHEFFKKLEKFADKLPVVEQELNFVFTGCYTSESRIKMANRIAEDRLYESEAYSAAATILGGADNSKSFEKAWENVMFNHFHDILPGSGVIETREYAMGLFQQTLAAANTNANNSLRRLAMSIDTASIDIDNDNLTLSEGGGVGFGVSEGSGYRFPQTERGRGKKRMFHLYNSTQYDHCGAVEITVWDWNYDISRAVFTDAQGNNVEYKSVSSGQHYWGHKFVKFVLDAVVPAFGYSTYFLDERNMEEKDALHKQDTRIDSYTDDNIVLENDKVKAIFERISMKVVSFEDKISGSRIVTPQTPSAYFRLITEDTVHGMSAWRVGNYMNILDLNEACDVKIYDISLGGARQWVSYEILFKNSKLNVTVSLDVHSSMLDFAVTVDWHEVGKQDKGIPQLNFIAPFAYTSSKYRYDIAFGTLDREPAAFDMPANSFVAALPEEGEQALMVVTDTKYGFRSVDNSIAVDLIRSSFNPDPYPEYGIHHIKIGVGITADTCNQTLFAQAARFVHPIAFLGGTKHEGKLPLCDRLLKTYGDIKVSAIKTPENGGEGKLIVRVYDANGKGTDAVLEFPCAVKEAVATDINELPCDCLSVKVEDKKVSFHLMPFAVATIEITL